jgi:hypothetical protein
LCNVKYWLLINAPEILGKNQQKRLEQSGRFFIVVCFSCLIGEFTKLAKPISMRNPKRP